MPARAGGDGDEDRATDTRGQAYTLEAVVAGLLLLASVGFALQMTAVTPLSASTSSQHVENQLKGTAEGILAAAAHEEQLKYAVLDWNESGVKFHNATDEGYHTTHPPKNQFGAMLNRSFDRQRVAYNVYVEYQTPGGTIKRTRMVYSGEPSDHAVSAKRLVTLVDSDHLIESTDRTDWDHVLVDTTVPKANFYAPDAFPTNGLYNIVRVEVVAWRI